MRAPSCYGGGSAAGRFNALPWLDETLWLYYGVRAFGAPGQLASTLAQRSPFALEDREFRARPSVPRGGAHTSHEGPALARRGHSRRASSGGARSAAITCSEWNRAAPKSALKDCYYGRVYRREVSSRMESHRFGPVLVCAGGRHSISRNIDRGCFRTTLAR